MKIKSGKITSLNKKLIATALTLTLAVPLVGCDDISVDSIKYTTNEQGNVGYAVSYDSLECCAIYKVYNNKTEQGYYTIGLQDVWNSSLYIKYYDIFTKEEITPSSFAFESAKALQEYLTEIDMVQEEYSEADLQQVLQTFVAGQEKTKQLTK